MQLSTDWRHVALHEVAEINPESLPGSTAHDFHFRYIDVATVAGPSEMGEARSMKFSEAPSRARRIVRDGDILVSTVRPYLRSFCRIQSAGNDLIASTGFAVVRTRSGIDGEFLNQHILSQWFVDHLTLRMKGSNYPAVSAADVGNYSMLLPPIAEQRRIASILSSVDEAIQSTQALVEQAQKVKQGVLQRLLTKGIGHTRFKQTKIGEIPEGWTVRKLGEVAEFINGRGFKPHEWASEGLPIIRIQNLNGGTDFNYYSGHYDPKLIVPPGSLLFAWSGSRGTSFGPHIWGGKTGLLNYHTWRVAPKEPAVADYLFYALLLLTRKIEADSHGASALVHMQKRTVVDYSIAFPPPSERNDIVKCLRTLDLVIANLNEEKTKQVELKSALMADLLTGRVRVSDDIPMAAE